MHEISCLQISTLIFSIVQERTENVAHKEANWRKRTKIGGETDRHVATIGGSESMLRPIGTRVYRTTGDWRRGRGRDQGSHARLVLLSFLRSFKPGGRREIEWKDRRREIVMTYLSTWQLFDFFYFRWMMSAPLQQFGPFSTLFLLNGSNERFWSFFFKRKNNIFHS